LSDWVDCDADIIAVAAAGGGGLCAPASIGESNRRAIEVAIAVDEDAMERRRALVIGAGSVSEETLSGKASADFSGVLISRSKLLNREARKGFAKVAKKSKIEIGTLPRLRAAGGSHWAAPSGLPRAAVPTWEQKRGPIAGAAFQRGQGGGRF
jgi:hypothetical protein